MRAISRSSELAMIPALITATSLFILFILESCVPKQESKDSSKEISVTADDFHADNDIAMTIRSLADAIKVGEPLDSTDYDFQGILTDGQGSPLYTDIQGAPGTWIVDIIDSGSAIIRNVYLGDLLPNDLRSYILNCLNIDENDIIEGLHADENPEDADTNISVYDFQGGFLRFEIRSAEAPNGIEGTLLTIILTSAPPPMVETQIAV